MIKRFWEKDTHWKNSLKSCQLYISIILHYPLQTVSKWCDISTISKFQYLNENIFRKILQLAISSLLVESFVLCVESLNVHFFSCFSELWIWVENLLQNCYLHISHIMSWCIKVFASRFGQNSSADIVSMFGKSVLKAPVRLSYVLVFAFPAFYAENLSWRLMSVSPMYCYVKYICYVFYICIASYIFFVSFIFFAYYICYAIYIF